MKVIKIEGIHDSYPETIEGTNEWFSYYESPISLCDLYEAEEMISYGKTFPGLIQHLIHFPDGKVYSPFSLKENVYVEKPIWNKEKLCFLVVDFNQKIAKICEYDWNKNVTRWIDEVSLTEVKDCYNLRLEVSPLMLGRSGQEGFFEIIWPEKKKIAIGECESVCFRDGDKLYCSRWVEDPEYHEYMVIRDIQTGEILHEEEGSILRLADEVYWKI